MSLSWMLLICAGLLEVAWAVGLKTTHGFTRLWPSIFTIAAMALSMYLLARAVRVIPVGTGYAVWTGIGAVGTAIIGMVFLGESTAVLRIVSLLLIITGLVGLKAGSM